MALKLITPPESYPVSLERAKQHIRVVGDDENDLIEVFLAAATSYVEEFTGRALIDQTWELTVDEFPDEEIRLPKAPLIEVVSVKYDDADGNEQTMPSADYTVDLVSEPGWVFTDGDWPSTFDGINAVRVRYRVGYLDSSSPPVANVPKDIVAAVLLTLGTLYAHRETVIVGQTTASLPWGAEQLLRNHRIEISMA
jgi:uncharacterized phiE125 gp8 family phage protein